MNRRSAHFVRAARWHHSELPLKGYFQWVGSALLVLLFAANWLLPTPPPNPLISSRVTLPPIRVYSKTQAPDEVTIGDVSSAIVGLLPESEAPPDGLSLSDSHSGETIPQRSLPFSRRREAHGRKGTASGSRALNTRETFAQFTPRLDIADPATRAKQP